MESLLIPEVSASFARTSPKKPKKNISLRTIALAGIALATKPTKPARDTGQSTKEGAIKISENDNFDTERGKSTPPTIAAVPPKPPRGDDSRQLPLETSSLNERLAAEIVSLHGVLRQRDKERLERQDSFEAQRAQVSSLRAEVDSLRLELGTRDYRLAALAQEKLQWQEESTLRFKELKKQIFELQETCRKHKIEILTKDSEIAAWRAERDTIETELDNCRKKTEREEIYKILAQKNIALNFEKERENIDEKFVHLNAEIKHLREENEKLAHDALQWKTRTMIQKRQYIVARGYAVNFGFTDNSVEGEESENCGESKSSIEDSHNVTNTRRTCQEEIQRYLQLISPSKIK